MENRYHLSKNYFQSPLQFEGISVLQLGRMYCKEKTVIEDHLHIDLYELTVVTGGSGKVYTNGIPTAVRRGDIYLSFPCDTHRIESDGADPLKYDFIAFYPQTERFQQAMEHLAQLCHAPQMRVFEETHIARLVSEAIAELDGGRPLAHEVLTTLLWQILLYLLRAFEHQEPTHARSTVTHAEELCYQMMNYIDTHIDSLRDLRQLGQVTGYSYGYLSSLFHHTTQQTLSHYYQEKRMNAAGVLIAEGRLKLNEIAEVLGYSSGYALSKAFRNATGKSPRDYKRKQSKE